MDIFEYAMKMEADGRRFYRDQAATMADSQLKEILLTLADEERQHYEYFKRMQDNPEDEKSRIFPTSSPALQKVKNIFEEMSLQPASKPFGRDAVSTWKEALRLEERTEKFYRDRAAEERNPARKRLLLEIAAIENGHAQMIDGVLVYLKDPAIFAESAQFKNFRSLEGR